MKIELKNMQLQNYKCFPEKSVEFYFGTKISGKNRAGKSTLQDAYMDVLTGKLTSGTQPDSIRPHDKSGVEIDKVDIVRELHIEKDGKPIEIRKITKQKWRKPRRASEEVLDGNETKYEVDGFSMNQKQFLAFMEQIAKPDLLLMCSNPNPFLTTLRKSTADARKLLENMSGFSVETFMEENPQYKQIAEITKGHSVEDTAKKLKKQLSEQKKKVEVKNTEIKCEMNRTSDSEIDEASLLENQKAWKERLESVESREKALENSVQFYHDLSAELVKLKSERDAYREQANASIKNKQSDLTLKFVSKGIEKQQVEQELDSAKFEMTRIEKQIAYYEEELKKAQKDYTDFSEQHFGEAEIQKIEVEHFDENELICPTCGQEYPEEKEQEIRSKFEKEKEKRIQEERDRNEKKLREIVQRGETSKRLLLEQKEEQSKCQTKIEELNQKAQEVQAESDALSVELEKIPAEVDLSGVEEYQVLLRQIESKEEQFSQLDSGSEKREEIRRMRNECMEELYKMDAQIRKSHADKEEKERRLTDLKNELREMAQVSADLERQIDLISEFSRLKNEALAQKVNPYFEAFDFKFLEYTQEGNPVETLKIVRNGTGYFEGLNYSDQILCNISLVVGLQKMNGLNLPVWVDNTESLNAVRIPEIEQQLILLEVSDGELEVLEIP